jgi:flagellar basal-body rod modification protein FlgD
MDFSTVVSGTSTSATSKANSTAQIMGKDDFLRLFVTQLKNQNPLSPMDSTGFTSQLAQFSSLEQLTNINTGISNLTLYQNSMQNALATGLIGKAVQVSGNQISLTAGGTSDISYSLSENAAQTKISISDASGKCVRQVTQGPQNAGNTTYSWDGKDTLGAALPSGTYTFKIEALNAAGAAVTASTLMSGTVTGIAFENNATYLVLTGGLKVQLGDIKKIGL